jgi:short subunit dehydrogenase-like uncharacterized protein
MTIPWGDVASAFHSTRIPNVEVYTAVPRRTLNVMRRLRCLAPLASVGFVQALGQRWINSRVQGPNEAERSGSRTEFWGQATGANGQSAAATLQTPNGYALTVQTALAAVERVLRGSVRSGFSTPAIAFGGRFIDDFDARFRWLARSPQEPV